MKSLLTAFTIFTLLACNSESGVAGDDVTILDPGSEEYTWPELFYPDGAIDDGTKDISDVASVWPVPVSMGCSLDSDCTTPCGNGICKDGFCNIEVVSNRCLVQTEEPFEALCYKEGQNSSNIPCLTCLPRLDRRRLVPAVFFESFEDGNSMLPVISDLTGAGIIWNLAGKRSHSGSSALYLGNPQTHDYAAGQSRVASEARWNNIQIPEGPSPRLTFFLFMETEQTEGYDVFTVGIETTNENVTMFNSDAIAGTTHGEFIPISIDLTKFEGLEVSLVFRFDTGDGGLNRYEGIYIDDLVVHTGCCEFDKDCDDYDACTEDHCPVIGGTCSYKRLDNCCNTDADCSDGNPCTNDICEKPLGHCIHLSVDGCCLTEKDCDDGNPCTMDRCSGPGKICAYIPLCCEKDSDCVSGDTCVVGSCTPDGWCSYTDVCCHADRDCDDNDPCTLDLCNMGSCAHKPANIPGCCFPTVLQAGFDAGNDGFDVSSNGFGWYVVNDLKSYSSPGALYFGDPDKLTFIESSDVSGEAISPVVYLQPDTSLTLSFWYWADTDSSWYVDSSLKAIIVSDGNEYTVWTKGWSSPQKKWTQVKADISAFGGREIRVKFIFEASLWYWGWEPEGNYGEGLYIDDVEIISSCAKKTCSSNSDCPSPDTCLSGQCQNGACNYVYSCCSVKEDCDDGNLCTTDECINQKCKFTSIKGCCMSASDCNDSNYCTEDICPGAGMQCVNQIIPGCCVKNKDCEDLDPCTKDTCKNNECVHENVCCFSDNDCDDGDDTCTDDLCVEGICKHVPTGADGCCVSNVYSASFENGELHGFQLDPPVDGVGWTVANVGYAFDGDWSLYYGNPEKLNFDNGNINSGYALSPIVTIPPGGSTLEFRVYMDVEGSASYDVLRVYWNEGSSSTMLWTKGSSFPMLEFVEVKIVMNAFGGRTGQVVFWFGTNDAYLNTGKGVFIDSILLSATCEPVACTSDSDCDDGLIVTKEYCISSTCSYEIGAGPECTSDWECDDDDFCTYDYCEDGKCVYEEDPWCWL